ncbi:MAG: FISUMP domain-containing protein [Bacilli bacterium]|jgi:uncharacterized protein (TIGR02145 family)/prepilin-type N-terminal cleavage/methylation domain-containing protein
MKKQGFTLIELLAVIMILGIILAITVPSIVGLIEKTTREAFLLDAKMVIKSINNKLLEDNKFDISLLDEVNIKEELNISKDNYQELIVNINDEGKIYVKLIGKNKWAGLTACGTYNKMKVGKTEEIKCEVVEDPFICGTPVLHGDYEYKTVLIGEQCWFKENLRYTGNEEDSCLNKEWDNLQACVRVGENICNGYCGWGEKEEILYQWQAVMNDDETGQGLCPKGWHIPSDNEWMILEAYVDSTYNNPLDEEWNQIGAFRGNDVGKRLKVEGYGNGTNNVGFSAYPAGYRDTPGEFFLTGLCAFWWTSTSSGPNALGRYVDSNSMGIHRGPGIQAYGYSVRCIKD